ncbi:MAG: hypothetical protein ABR583_07115 [Gaiellaceae bacterium]
MRSILFGSGTRDSRRWRREHLMLAALACAVAAAFCGEWPGMGCRRVVFDCRDRLGRVDSADATMNADRRAALGDLGLAEITRRRESTF